MELRWSRWIPRHLPHLATSFTGISAPSARGSSRSDRGPRPVTDISYDMEQGVSGEGFVNVHNDYSTHVEPRTITNCAYAKADIQPTII